MKLSLWSSNKAPVPETKVVVERHSKASGSSKGKKKKERSSGSIKTPERYEIDKRKAQSLETREDVVHDEADGTYPLIDRVPTAMGYHSDGSEDEWLEERSKCSRYSINDDPDDDVDEDDDDADREAVPDDEPDDSADRYSRKAVKEKKKKTKQKNKKKKEQPITISRLWSESTDSDASPPQWGADPDPVMVSTNERPPPRDQHGGVAYDPGDMSYPEERGGDPIYDVSAKNKNKGETAKSGKKIGGVIEMHPSASMDQPDSPKSVESVTSDLTDPLDNMLHFSATTKVVKEIEDKLKLLKKVAKDERAFAKKNKKAALKSAKAKKPASKTAESKEAKSKEGALETNVSKVASTSRSKAKSAKPEAPPEKVAQQSRPKAKVVKASPDKNETTRPIVSSIWTSSEKPVASEALEPQTTEREFLHRILPFEEPATKPTLTTATLRNTATSIVKKQDSAKKSKQSSRSDGRSAGLKDIVQKARSRDQIEMSRTISLAETVPPKVETKAPGRRPLPQRLPKTLPKALAKTKSIDDTLTSHSEPTAETTDRSEPAESKTAQELGDMYTRSLLTEDSEIDLALKSTMSESQAAGQMKKKTKPRSKATTKPAKSSVTSRQISDRDLKSFACPSPSWKFGVRSKGSDATSIKKNNSFWSKRANRAPRAKSTPTGTSEQSNFQDGLQNREATSKSERKGKKKEMKELDEYSGMAKESTAAEPDVVQCLRFYACGTVANQVNTAIRISECGDAGFQCGAQASNEIAEDRAFPNSSYCSSPVPTVEVVLEEGQEGTATATQSGSGQSRSAWNPIIFHDDDEFLEEAPPLPLSRVPSIVVNVSEMQLHLDGDSETERKPTAPRDEKVEREPKSDVSITSIILPNASKTKSSSVRASDESTRYNEEEELQLEEYIERINGKKGLRGLFARFRKRS